MSTFDLRDSVYQQDKFVILKMLPSEEAMKIYSYPPMMETKNDLLIATQWRRGQGRGDHNEQSTRMISKTVSGR